MKIVPKSYLSETKVFWKDVSVAGGQVTFGVVAATWFIPPFDGAKFVVLLLNAFATALFIISGIRFIRQHA